MRIENLNLLSMSYISFFLVKGSIRPLKRFWPFCERHMSEKRAHFHSLATARVASPRTRARGSRRVAAAHLCAREWNSWIRWRCAVDGAARRARRRNDLISSPFDRASRVLCERFGSAARRQSFARSDRASRKFEFASADIQVDAVHTRRSKAGPHRRHESSTTD